MGLYSAKVYKPEDGGELVVGSSGFITVQSGGEIDVESGGSIDVESGGSLDIEAGGKLTEPVENGSTAASLKNYGVSVLSPTTKKVYTLAAPVAGVRKTIYCTVASTSKHAYVYSGASTIAFTTTSTQRALKFSKAVRGYVSMIAISTARWLVLNKTTSVSYTTGTTGA